MKKLLSILLIIGSLLFGVISYNALAVTHYDLDPVGVLASVLNISIPILGGVSGVASVVLLIGGILLLRS
ncbi:MAG: hypothetical protein KDE47_00985 [Caldilineaceae bacterium]|nr:hypothetical protein [Caldilineaceae bacterium]